MVAVAPASWALIWAATSVMAWPVPAAMRTVWIVDLVLTNTSPIFDNVVAD